MANKSRITANLVSNTGISTFTDLNITRVNITGVGTISNGSITNLTGTAATITTGNFTTGNIVTGVVTNFTSTNGSISNLTGTSSTITTFTSTNGSITNLTGTAATITTLRSTTGNFTTGNIVTGVTTNFTSTNGSITNLTGTAATITTGNFTTGNIVTGVTTNFTSTNVVITGVTTVSAGTALLPSISPSGDPNTGIFFPSADTIAFGEGGAEAVRIDSSGRMLVGSTTNRSGSLLQVVSSTPVITVSQSSSSVEIDTLMGAFNVYSNDSSTTSSGGIGGIRIFSETAYNSSQTPSYMSFYTHGASANSATEFGNVGERARIRSNGMFEVKGAGTAGSSPAFSVNGSAPANSAVIDSSGRLLVGSATASAAGGELLSIKGIEPRFILRSTGGDPGLFFFDNVDTIANSCRLIYNDNVSFAVGTVISLPLIFETANTERARIDTSGRLLVGTTTAPSAGELLKVNKGPTGTEGAGVNFNGAYSLVDDASQTINILHSGLLLITENTNGKAGLLFATYISATITIISDPSSIFATADTDTKLCVFKSANTTAITIKNRLGVTHEIGVAKITSM